jgi:UDP-N-acetylmuramyl pentapeptide synthase
VRPVDDDRLAHWAKTHRPDARHVTFGDGHGADVRLVAYTPTDTGGTIDLDIFGEKRSLTLGLVGRHTAIDACAAIAAAHAAGASIDQALAGVARAKPPAMRGEIVDVAGRHVIVDCYNANPASMAAALRALAERTGAPHRGTTKRGFPAPTAPGVAEPPHPAGHAIDAAITSDDSATVTGTIDHEPTKRGIAVPVVVAARPIADGAPAPRAARERAATQSGVGVASPGAVARGIAVVGDMLELGDHAPSAHREIGELARELGVGVIALGEFASTVANAADGEVAADPDAAAARALARTQPGDWILLKASRGMRLERVLAAMTKARV